MSLPYIWVLGLVAGWLGAAERIESLYPAPDDRTASPGHITYRVDPFSGDNAAPAGKPWRSFSRLNHLRLAPGDLVIISPGTQMCSLVPAGGGTEAEPVVFRFLPGVHIFAAENAIRETMYVSNSCDTPKDKPIAILVRGMRHVRFEGAPGPVLPTIMAGGRMVQIFNDHSEDVTYTNLAFDLKRPTMSEFFVEKASGPVAVIAVAEGSTYSIVDNRFNWTGDWGPGKSVQEAVPAQGTCWRRDDLRGWKSSGQVEATAMELGNARVSLTFPNGDSGLTAGHQYQISTRLRDRVGIHTARCAHITFHDCTVHALVGMGFVSQFTDTMTIQHVDVVPPLGTRRTAVAWADIFQFSSCRGQITVNGCQLSGMGDDAINCHGTHLRIIKASGPNQVLVRFMQSQTYGFAAFALGDEVAVINSKNLREYANNPRRHVTAVNQVDGKQWQVTLDGPVPTWAQDDVIDNITWYPDLTITNNYVSMDPVRGFLITTRGKTLVEGNTFHHCNMAGILIEDDAEGWFESGPIRDLLIRNNRFLGCGIQISPHANIHIKGEPIHENICITGNRFESCGINAEGVGNMRITGNTSTPGPLSVNLHPACSDVVVQGNAP